VAHAQLVTPQPDPGPAVAPYVTVAAPEPSRDQLIAELRARVRYVFVIFNENHSFDSEFGTFPGANGIFSDGTAPRDAAHTPGFNQSYTDANGQRVNVQPFRIGPEQNATFMDSVDHSHTGLAAKLQVTKGVAAMDGFAQAEYRRFASKGGAQNAAMGTQFARLTMSYIDCDTIPFLWQYANRFTLFDNIFATEDTPSTPNAVAMLAGQSGETQWVKHGATGKAMQVGDSSGTTQGPPLVNDPQPIWGSQFDTTTTDREPRGAVIVPGKPGENYGNGNIASNLTFAALPLTFAANGIDTAIAEDRLPDTDLADLKQDIPFIAALHGQPVNWRWYQEGYDHEPTDPGPTATHAGYVSHHNGAQYFGYIVNNPGLQRNLHGLGDAFRDLALDDLPLSGGVFYIRGGFQNIAGLLPPIQNAHYPNPAGLTPAEISAINNNKSGDDDHPGYTDRQISEAMNARVINAIASRPEIWNQSAIIITYDESDGLYDHVPPRILAYGPDKLPLARGIRVPTIVISPYARVHAVSHAEGDHNAVIETIEAIFDLPPLATLPEEKQALQAGEKPEFNGPDGFVQHHLGPRDINSPETDDLLSAFEPRRLSGDLPAIPGSFAMIPNSDVTALPHYNGKGCSAIGMTPEDQRQHIATTVPPGFNTLPATFPDYN
jgi:phospholipase C